MSKYTIFFLTFYLIVSLTGASSLTNTTTKGTTNNNDYVFMCSSFLANTQLQILQNYSYVVFLNNDLWLYGGKTTVRSNNQWYDSELGTLNRTTTGNYVGTDALGTFNGYEMNYTAIDNTFTVTSRFKCYSSFAPTYGAFVFETVFPQGLINTTTDNLSTTSATYPWSSNAIVNGSKLRTTSSGGEFNSSTLPLVQFPSFICMPYNRLGGTLGFLEWNGRFTNDNIAIGNGLRGFNGGQTGGPLIIYDSNSTRWQPGTNNAALAKPVAVLLAPLTEVKSSILGIVEDIAHEGNLWRLVGGPQGHITSLPIGYTYSFTILGSPYGITNITYNYGSVMRTYYGTWKIGGYVQDIQSSIVDPLTYILSYWTDNGAYYFGGYWSNYLNSTNNGNTIFPALYEYHQSNGLTIGTYQFDPWWYPQPGNGCNNWTYDPHIFPEGLAPLVDQGLQFTLYSSYYGGNLTLMNEGMPGYNWRQSEYFNAGWFDGYISLPGLDDTYRFYTDMFTRAKTNRWSMTNYEIDFMDFLNLCFTEHNVNATALQIWETAVARAALDADMTVQLCMDLPSDALFTAQAPAFTNARASEDDFPTNDGRWNIGITSILYGALNLKPFYDDFWTTSHQPRDDNPYGPDASENFTEVSAILSVLSTGPVGISDGIGFTNISLVNMTMMADGRILKPSLPAGMIDAYFASRSGNTDYGIPGNGVIFTAPSFVPLSAGTAFPTLPTAGTVDAPTPYPYVSVLAIDVPAPGFTLYPWDLSPDLTTSNVSIVSSLETTNGNDGVTNPAPIGGVSVQSYVSVPWSNGMEYITQTACKDGNPACGCVSMFNAMNPLGIQTGGENTDHSKPHELYHLSPLYGNGWSLIGELDKITRVSVTRFLWINGGTNSSSNLTFAVNGTVNETVNIAFVVPPSPSSVGKGSGEQGTAKGTCSVAPLQNKGGKDMNSRANTIVSGTIKVIQVTFTSVSQKIITCSGSGSTAECTY